VESEDDEKDEEDEEDEEGTASAAAAAAAARSSKRLAAIRKTSESIMRYERPQNVAAQNVAAQRVAAAAKQKQQVEATAWSSTDNRK
jgi:hypothetical protein